MSNHSNEPRVWVPMPNDNRTPTQLSGKALLARAAQRTDRIRELEAENKRLRDALLPLYEYIRDNVDLDAVDERTGAAVNAAQDLAAGAAETAGG